MSHFRPEKIGIFKKFQMPTRERVSQNVLLPSFFIAHFFGVRVGVGIPVKSARAPNSSPFSLPICGNDFFFWL